jgi:hypothetical protein
VREHVRAEQIVEAALGHLIPRRTRSAISGSTAFIA